MARRHPVDLADDTFVVAAPADVARAVADRRRWARWWPDLELRVTRDRGREGIQWAVTGAVTGTMEIWLEPYADGVLLHYYLRGETTSRFPRRPRLAEPRARAWKRHVHHLKDHLEANRPSRG